MESGMTLQELAKSLFRQRWALMVTFGVALLIGTAVVFSIPQVWRATTVVRVESHRPAPELVSASVSQMPEDRLKTVAQELFSRPVLERAIQQLNLEAKLVKQKGMESAVEALKAQLDVKVEGDAAFVLAVTGADPQTVAKTANLLPQLFLEQASLVRMTQAKNTTSLFDDELKRLGKNVLDRESQIGTFKLAHLGELPEQAESNMRSLDRIMVLLTARTDSRRELQRHQVELASSRENLATELGRLRRSALDINQAMRDARSQWTDDHPEPRRLGRQLETVQGKLEKLESNSADEDAINAQVKSQLSALNDEIRSLEKQAQFYRERLDRTPRWGQQLMDLNRDYDIMRTKYQSLVSRKVEAELAYDLEAKAKANLFHVLSAAVPPVKPYKPDRVTGMVLALLAALAVALLVGVFRELHDDSLRRAEQARDLKVPVLALVPRVTTNKAQAR